MSDRIPGSPLRVARVRAGWKQGALAAAVGLNVTSLWRIEAGRSKPKLKTRQKLAAVLKVKEAVLFKVRK
jgi:DNA-binding XRE family transcriptional regulator